MIEGLFLSLTVAELTTMRAEWVACLRSIAVGTQSYSIAGRTFTRANLSEVKNTLAEIAYAMDVKSGNVVRTTYADLSA
jgi:hypothetical protein